MKASPFGKLLLHKNSRKKKRNGHGVGVWKGIRNGWEPFVSALYSWQWKKGQVIET